MVIPIVTLTGEAREADIGIAFGKGSGMLFKKGKTIKEALKITKDNVIESLGGLPKIKYHCSVLAVDALVEAIFDYFVKKGMDIPAGLQKKHDVIKKSKDIIEKRYEKWA